MTQKNANQQGTSLQQGIRRLVVDGLTESINQAIHAASADLYKVLESVEDWLRADYTLSINMLENNDEWFAAQVIGKVERSLNELFSGSWQSSQASKSDTQGVSGKQQQGKGSFDIESLSLVSKDEFEDWLTARTGVKFLENELGYELQEAIYVLTSINNDNLDFKNCPFGPETIFRALKDALDEIEFPTSPQALFYKKVARSVLDDLKDLYRSIVALAKKHHVSYESVKAERSQPINKGDGSESDTAKDPTQTADHDNVDPRGSVGSGSQDPIEPTGGADYSTHANPSQVAPPGFASGADLSAQQVGVSEDEHPPQQPTGASTLNTLARMNTSLASGGSLGRGDASQDAFNHSQGLVSNQAPQQLIGAISQLQQLHGGNEVIEKKKLRSWIQSGITKIPGQPNVKITRSDSELIDVTDRFFEVIIEKIGVSGLLEKWLEKLKLTILKVVLRDKTFFSNAQHPARQMLNKLAKLAANEKTDKKRLERVLDKYIDRVVEEFDRDELAIEKVLAELDELLERQANAQKRNSDRIARAYEGKQKVANARHLVIKDIGNLINGESVPVVLMELLDKAGWREHLALLCVREGHASTAYDEALNVVDLIMNWLGEDVDSTDKWALELEMELEAPSVVELITRELGVVGLVGYEGVIKRLEDCLFNEADPMLVKVNKYEWPYDKSEKEIDKLKPDNSQDPNASHWHKRIVSMKVGDWLEITDENKRSRCLRLAWSGSESFRFVFVDSQGMKDEDLSLDDLVELFKQNRASFVDNADVPLVDQGLHQMVQSVYEELAGQSSCDVLTGLLNRQAFDRGLDQTIASAISGKSAASLLYIDVDKFNLVNTSYGHSAGDALLKHIASMIRDEGIEGAFCGRLGGNEFGMILPQCQVDSAQEIAARLCQGVSSSDFFWEDHCIKASVSIGVTEFNVELDSGDTILRKAATACELAKDQGRNRTVVYQEQDKDQAKRNEMVRWVQRLDEDLDDLLTLRCQEIRPVDMDGKSRPHYEVLLGVRENGQILPPGMLIEAAEHYGRMSKVDRWVIHHTLRWMEMNPLAVARSDGFSINLSGNSLSDASFLEFILGQFAASGVSPRLICFEITETAAITNLADATEFIRVLKQSGCQFSLDDFGTGLSSYAYIQKLPVDYIKIDGVFIRNIANSEQDQALVKSINELAHFMGIKTVAEFVENHDILAVLKTIGVDSCQGFGIKKPSLLDELSL